MNLEAIKKHHQLETKLHRLRLLRDLKHPDFRQQDEDKILDEMERIWNGLTEEEQKRLEDVQKIFSFSEYSPDMPDLDRKSGLPDISKVTDVIKSGGQVPLKSLSMRLHEDESGETPDFIKFDPDECQSPETCGICHYCHKTWSDCQCGADLTEFRKFFDRMGVDYEDIGSLGKYGNSYLGVGRSIFWFKDSRFTGVEWGETGAFHLRK